MLVSPVDADASRCLLKRLKAHDTHHMRRGRRHKDVCVSAMTLAADSAETPMNEVRCQHNTSMLSASILHSPQVSRKNNVCIFALGCSAQVRVTISTSKMFVAAQLAFVLLLWRMQLVSPASAPTGANFTQAAQTFQDDSTINSAYLVVRRVSDGTLLFEASKGTGTAAAADSGYTIASGTKWISAATIMKLVENGALRLDSTLGEGTVVTVTFPSDRVIAGTEAAQ